MGRWEGDKGGLKPVVIDYPKLDSMCAIHCTGEECASLLDMDYDTLNRRLKIDGHGGFTEYFKQKSAGGKMSLRRRQFTQANEGNSTMLIWLGKQWLGQSDKNDTPIADSSNTVINFNVKEAKSEVIVTRGE